MWFSSISTEGDWANSRIQLSVFRSFGSKIFPSFLHLNIPFSILQPPQVTRARFQAAVVIVAETGCLHQVADLLHVVLDAVQCEFTRFVDGESGARIPVSRLSHRAGITMNLPAETLDALHVCMSGNEALANHSLEISGGGFQVFIDRICPAAVHDLNLAHANLHRQRSERLQMICFDHL